MIVIFIITAQVRLAFNCEQCVLVIAGIYCFIVVSFDVKPFSNACCLAGAFMLNNDLFENIHR